MTEASWSQCQEADCIRLGGLSPAAGVEVRPGVPGAGRFPAMAGAVVVDGGDRCFVPRFPFVDGTTYTVTIDGTTTAVLLRRGPELKSATEVLRIDPTARAVPRNLLRLYVSFSAPMSEGDAAEHIRLVDDAGEPIAGGLLPTEHELWDPDHTRLTVLLDPARIKRGLVGHREAGYPLRVGTPFRLLVDEGCRDARGVPLRAEAERRWEVVGDERLHVDPQRWALTPPRGTEQLEVAFDKPLDGGLLARCLAVTGPTGRRVGGVGQRGAQDCSWRFVPEEPWVPGLHHLVVDPVLEDLAGNSVRRVFDRDLSNDGEDPREDRPVMLPFRPR